MDRRTVTKGFSKARVHYKKYERIRINRTIRRKGKQNEGRHQLGNVDTDNRG